MAKIVIQDLERNDELDREAMRKFAGGQSGLKPNYFLNQQPVNTAHAGSFNSLSMDSLSSEDLDFQSAMNKQSRQSQKVSEVIGATQDTGGSIINNIRE